MHLFKNVSDIQTSHLAADDNKSNIDYSLIEITTANLKLSF